MPIANTPEEKAQQTQALQEMCDTFQQEGAEISYDQAVTIQPRNPRVPVINVPIQVNIDNTTAEQSILGRIQAFLQQRGFDVNPFEGEMKSIGNPPFDMLWKAPVSSPKAKIKNLLDRSMDPKNKDRHLDFQG